MPTVKRRTLPARAATNFPDAPRYAACLRRHPAAVREPARSRPPPFCERHLQCIWFDPQFRPSQLVTLDGEPVAVQQPGRWNLEAGPDFLDASLIIGPDRRALRGDVEVHVHPTDWAHHGHGSDSLYRHVVAHVCYWPGRLPEGTLPRPAVQLALKPALDSDPGFFFESIDLTAYPYAVPPPSVPDRPPPLSALSAADAARFLAAAGQERLRQKADAMADRIAREGEAQPLFESVLAALGYQHNRGICRRLARVITLERLRTEAQGSPRLAYALLLGVAGLMPRTSDPAWDADTRRFVRSLWDDWWKMQSRWDEPRRLPRHAWRLSGIRPQNHPVRRLAAAAALFARPDPLPTTLRKIATGNPTRWLVAVRELFNVDAEFPYWQSRLSFGGKPTATSVALIGSPRQSALMLNALIPHLATVGADVTRLIDAIPPEDSNQIVRQTANLIFGPDHNPAIYAGGLTQQGLLQIFYDFCLPNRLDDLAQAAQ